MYVFALCVHLLNAQGRLVDAQASLCLFGRLHDKYQTPTVSQLSFQTRSNAYDIKIVLSSHKE